MELGSSGYTWTTSPTFLLRTLCARNTGHVQHTSLTERERQRERDTERDRQRQKQREREWRRKRSRERESKRARVRVSGWACIWEYACKYEACDCVLTLVGLSQAGGGRVDDICRPLDVRHQEGQALRLRVRAVRLGQDFTLVFLWPGRGRKGYNKVPH